MQVWGRRNSVAVAVLAAALAAGGFWQAATGHFLVGVALLAGGFAVLLPAFFGRGVGSVDDAMLLMQLVRNPADTVYDQIDAAFDRETARSARQKPTAAAPIDYPESDTFDPDAAFARYMEKSRAAGANATTVPNDGRAGPVRTFGRKSV